MNMINEWYLVIPMDKKRKTPIGDEKKEICAVDPGIKTFQTIYSNSNVVKISKDPLLLKRLQLKLDVMQSLRSKKKIKQSSYLRRRKRLYRRQANVINELHFKTASYVTENYKTNNGYKNIILPIFESQKMTKNSKKRQMNRNLLELAHYKFKERRKEKCIQRNCQLHICTKEYTSKMYGVCGKIEPLKNYVVFECYRCGVKID
jgi:transposase